MKAWWLRYRAAVARAISPKKAATAYYLAGTVASIVSAVTGIITLAVTLKRK